MPDQVGTVAETLSETFLWSELGGGELILALIVALVLLAFAFPARLSETRQPDDTRARLRNLSHR